MSVIKGCLKEDSKELKKLVMMYWEVVKKYDAEGKLLPEMILVTFCRLLVLLVLAMVVLFSFRCYGYYYSRSLNSQMTTRETSSINGVEVYTHSRVCL